MHNPFSASQHPPETDLILYVDGELSPSKTGRIRTHLEHCWRCRRAVTQIQETISGFLAYLDNDYTPALPPPPQRWTRFGPRLSNLPRNRQPAPAVRRVLSSLGFRAAAVASIVGAFLFWISWPTALSADQFLARAAGSEARTERRAKTLSVRCGRRQLVRFLPKRALQRKVISSADSSFEHELEAIYAANRLDWDDPLSVSAFARWRDGLTRKRDSIRRSAGELTLQTVSEAADATGTVVSAELTVRQEDYQPVEQKLRIKQHPSDLDIEVKELAGTPTPSQESGSGAVGSNIAAKPQSRSDGVQTSSPPNRIETTASPDLEIKALLLLHSVGADLGQEAAVHRDPTGKLRVSGVIDDVARRAELARALEPLAANPAVQIQLQSTEEALKTLPRLREADAPTPASKTGVSSIAAEPVLRSYLARSGASEEGIQARINALALETVACSQRALLRTMALHDLASRFTADQLSEPARQQWTELVQDHARAFRREASQLQNLLGPVFQASKEANDPADDAATDVAESSSKRTIDELFRLTKQSDDAIRAEFTISDTVRARTSVAETEFWRRLRRAEYLAKHLSRPGPE